LDIKLKGNGLSFLWFRSQCFTTSNVPSLRVVAATFYRHGYCTTTDLLLCASTSMPLQFSRYHFVLKKGAVDSGLSGGWFEVFESAVRLER
jgi:hypothetical protein